MSEMTAAEWLAFAADGLPPVRLCCGRRHWGAQCPDGLVMCQLCFSRFPLGGLHVTDDGPEDVCRGCAADELAWMAVHGRVTGGLSDA